MKLLIDNLDGRGALDYSGCVEMSKPVSVVRRLNRLSELTLELVSVNNTFVVPVIGARVLLARNDNSNVFSGYLTKAPSYRYLGWGDRGAQFAYELTALSDAVLLDQKAPPPEPPFVAESAGGAFDRLTLDAMPGWFDLTGVQAGDPIPYYSVDPAKTWAASAAEIALAARFSYRDEGGKLYFGALAQNTYPLAESDPSYSPGDLRLESVNRIVNDLTVLGQPEPAAHVKDYFVGDGYTTTFYLSQIPFTRSIEIPLYNRTILNEEYLELDPSHWTVVDPTNALSVSNGQLQVAGGNGQDGQTCLEFVEQVELGGATILNHGDVAFSAASTGVIGGLYAGAVALSNCMSGFRITPSGANCSIQALTNGNATGSPLVTLPGHHYVFTTYLYPTEIYRMQQLFHSSTHPSGSARGGAAIPCDVRVVLQVQDIDPNNPATQVAPATVLYDGVISNAPGFCTYAPINAASMQCSVAFTYIHLATDALVRTTLEGESPVTARTGSLIDGAECRVSNTPALNFFPAYIPAANEAIEVTYRSQGHAAARVVNSANIAASKNGADDGVRGSVRQVAIPVARTSADCEIAALALLDDAGQGWAGEYQAWSTFLPGGAEDIFPGDGLAVDVASLGAAFRAIVLEADLAVLDFAGETVRYTLKFVDAGDPALGFAFDSATKKQGQVLTGIDVTQVGQTYLNDLLNAEVTTITSTTVTIDAGVTPAAGGGIEVRYSDTAWGAGNSRNLLGRFTTRAFTLPRYARGQNYFLRSYDNSSPAKYSRYSTALHVDYPL